LQDLEKKQQQIKKESKDNAQKEKINILNPLIIFVVIITLFFSSVIAIKMRKKKTT
jgi:hypothetical protein